MGNVVAIFLGAGVGGVLRHLLAIAITGDYHGRFPLATFLINIAGCFAIGYLATLFMHVPFRDSVKLGLTVGLLGGFTTFSSFARETFVLLGDGKPLIAFWYVLASNLIGIGLAFAGHMMAKSIHV